ncbi:MAG TPA: PDZ domain-containing protein, partial [Pyrinomonadaceae bacterium]|nr:PDZ domain-containing protein [Pyrinomonadaceae bacterium]
MILFSVTSAFSAQQTNASLLIGRVSANQTQIAFASAGKIWIVDKNGGTARRLTNTPNDESDPIFSPDGKQIAFSRLNGSDWDIYVISSDGKGEARRVTMMPKNDYMVNWTPDGKSVIFATTRDEENVFRLYKMAVEGGTIAEPLPLPQALDGAFSPDGKQIAYNPRIFIFGEWRYYRGGAAAPIWITNLQTGATDKLPNQNFNDKNPMWIGDKIYFNSDRTGTYNLFVYDRKLKQAKQLTKFIGQGIRIASAANDSICFVQDGRIHLFDLATNQDKIVNVSISPDTTELAPRTVPAMRSLEQILPSANGEKVVFGARGEVLLFDVATSEAKNLTNTSGTAERYPTISPDNKSVAYFSDESGEYQLHIRSLENNSVKKITIEPKPSLYMNLAWSPDSKKLVFNDRRLNLWLADTESGTTVKVDSSTYSAQDNWLANFSPDSRFLTYAKRLKNRAGTVFIYDLAQKKSTQITDGITHAESPVFDTNGKYLYFLSSRNALTSEFNWGVLNGVFSRPLVTRNVQAFVLAKDSPSPILPTRQPNPDAKVTESSAQVKIDFDNLEKRIIDLPLPPRDYGQLLAGKAGKLFLAVGEWSNTPGDFNSQSQTTAVYLFDLAKSGEMQKIVENINGFDLSRDGSKLLYGKRGDWFVVNSETPPKADEGKLNIAKMEIKINPAEEWRQIFHESMRIMRDWFYDPNHHGQNLKELENYYTTYLPNITRRRDLNTLMERMLGSVSVSHLGVGGGDIPPPAGAPVPRVGVLGADYAIENGKYRFKKILRGTSYASPNGFSLAPLDQIGVDVREGDY